MANTMTTPASVTDAPGTLPMITRLSRRVYREASEAVLGMNMKHFVLLNLLNEDVGTQQQQLGEHLCMAANNLVLLLNEVEREGWAQRRRDSGDRRRHLVFRTPAGTEALVRAEQGMDSVEDRVLDSLDADERATLRALLARALSP